MKYLQTLTDEVNEEKLNKLARYISKIDSMLTSKDFALVLLGDMLSIVTFYPGGSTYESMKYSGNLNLIRQYKL